MLNGAIESLVQKVQSGVVIQFEKIGPDPPPLLPEGVLKQENDIIGLKGKQTSCPFRRDEVSI